DEAVERDATPPLDRLQELGGRLLAPPLAHDQVSLALVQPEDVAGSADQAVLPESGDVLAAEAFDVERLPGDEVAQPLDRLRRADQPPRAAAHDVLLPGRGIDRARREAAASGAVLGEHERAGIRRPRLLDPGPHLGNDVAGALDHPATADPDILAAEPGPV